MNKSSLPAPKQKRAQETVERLIVATDLAMREGGEAAVRIQDISATTGVSVGSIYHHFRDRDGLIRATYAHNYAKVVATDIPMVKNFFHNLTSFEDLLANYDTMVEFVKQHFACQSALDRAAIVGTSAGRPLMRKELARVQHDLNENATEIMEIARERGLLKDHLNPRAAAMVSLGLLLGRAVAELDSEPVSEHDWTVAALSAVGGLLKTPSRSQTQP
jgi:AcrR family transcriptional regulator